MRMWMVPTSTLCLKHLLGEHVEHHMFVGSMKKKLSMSGYIKNNLLEPRSLLKRHEAIVKEMDKRGLNHRSPLLTEKEHLELIDYLPDSEKLYVIDSYSAMQDLHSRCPNCKASYDLYSDLILKCK